MTATPGPRRLTMTSWHGDEIRVGDLLRSTAGTVYLVQRVGVGRVNPYVLDVTRLGERDAPAFLDDPDVVVHEFHWNPRKRKQRA